MPPGYPPGVAVYPYPYPAPAPIPYVYPYPPPGYYPYPAVVIVQPPREETKKGVKHVSTALFLYIVTQFVLFGLSVLLYAFVIPALLAVGPGNIRTLLVLAVAVLAVLGILLIIILIALIFGLIGLIGVRKGMDEFGPEHREAVEKATVLIVLGVVASISGSVVGFVAGGGGSVGALAFQIIASGVAGVAAAALIGLGVVRLVEKLADAAEKKNLWLFFYLTLAGTAAAAVLAFVWVVVALASLQQGNLNSLGAAGLLGITSVVVAIGYYFGWEAYSSIGKKLETGKLAPGMPLPGGAPAPGAAVAVPSAAAPSSPKPK